MSKVKCIIRQSWTTRDEAGNLIDRCNNLYVTNEDGTPYIYASIAEARAEIRANYGRDANRAGILHAHSVDEYSGHTHDGYVFIVREDTDEYTEATRAAEAMNETNEAMSEASEAERKTIEAAINYDPEAAAKYAKQAEEAAQRAEAAADRAASMDPTTADVVYEEATWARAYADRATETAEANANELEQRAETMSKIHEATRAAADRAARAIAGSVRRHPRTMNEIEYTASEAVSQLMSAYANVTGCSAYDIPQDVWQAAYRVAAVDIIPEPERPAGYADASADDRATVSDIVGTIARAEIIATISDPAEREHIAHEADRYQWTPEETRANVEYQKTISAANRAAAAFVAAYAEASGEDLTEDDDETRAAYLVARDEITGTSERATDYDRAMVDGMIQTIAAAVAYMRPFVVADAASRAFVAAYAEAIGETIVESDPEARASHLVARAEIAGSHASDYDRAMVRDMLEAIAERWTQDHEQYAAEFAAPAPTYQRHELEAYLGEPDAYDVEAIEAEATAYDPKSGARVWVAFGEDLAAICERHELYEYAPAV